MYICTIDQSTSSTKAILFNGEGKLIYRASKDHKQIYPQAGWVEHDPMEILENIKALLTDMAQEAKKINATIGVLSITNQRETVLVWDRNTGKPVYNAIVWQCNRAHLICQGLKDNSEIIEHKTGLKMSPYFSAPKIKWILDNVPDARSKAEKGDLVFGTMDSWVLWNLTGEHATDFSNASRTQLFNLETLKWDDELFKIFGIPINMAPEIKASDEIFGYAKLGGLSVPVSGIMGDSHGALFGQKCFQAGMAKVTYGTGSSVMLNTGSLVRSKNGLVTSIGWSKKDQTVYVLEGNINYSGACVSWLIDNLNLIESSAECGRLAASAEHTGVYFVPAFTGLGAPYWCSSARARLVGITAGTQKVDVVRAFDEAIAYQIEAVLKAMRFDAGRGISLLRADGGATRDEFLMQFQADISDVTVRRNSVDALSAMGSAYMAGLAVGHWKELKDLEELDSEEKDFTPKMDGKTREGYWSGWEKAVFETLESANK